MVVKQVRDGRFWSVEVIERLDNDAVVIFAKDKSRVVVKARGLTVVIENKSLKELNNEQ